MIPIYNDPNQTVEIIQGDKEFRELLKIYEDLRPRNVLEIGCLFGGTTQHWVEKAPDGAVIITLDLLVSQADGRYATQVYNREYVWPTWNNGRKTTFHLLGASTYMRRDVEELLAGDKLDFLFIDGDHTYNGVKADWDTYLPLMEKGGVVAFHDIKRDTAIDQVWQLWDEIKAAGYKTRELTSIDNQQDWGIGVVFI